MLSTGETVFRSRFPLSLIVGNDIPSPEDSLQLGLLAVPGDSFGPLTLALDTNLDSQPFSRANLWWRARDEQVFDSDSLPKRLSAQDFIDPDIEFQVGIASGNTTSFRAVVQSIRRVPEPHTLDAVLLAVTLVVAGQRR